MPPSGKDRVLIGARLLGSVFLPVLEEIGEEVAAPGEIDRGARSAFRFASGPVAMMRELGPAEVARVVELVARPLRHPVPRFQRSF